MKSRLFKPQGFSLFFITVLLIHASFLLVHIKKDNFVADEKRIITLRLVPETTFKNLIVNSSDSDQRIAEENAYLSDKTRSFDRQTKAKIPAPFSESRRSSGEKQDKGFSLSKLGEMVQGDPFQQAAREYSRKKNGNGRQSADRSVSSTSDYLNDIPPGDLTELNTVEYKYYGFYHRIRQKLEQFWGRSLQEKAEELARTGRRVPTSEELITAIVVVLNQRGHIIDLYLKGSSGIRELDDAAIEAFNEAGPFPNPPKGMLVNGKVTLEWGFVVKS